MRLAALLNICSAIVVAGELRGVCVDPAEASLPAATVRVLRSDARTLVARGIADERGNFRFGHVKAGTYLITVWLQGFRARLIDNVAITENGTTDLGKIQFEFAGCDAPGVMCDGVTGGRTT